MRLRRPSYINGKRCLSSSGTTIQSELAEIWLANLKFCDRLQNFEDASDKASLNEFRIFPPLHLAPNPPTSQCFSFSLSVVACFPPYVSSPHSPYYIFSPSLLLHVFLVYLCSPLIRLRQGQFFWPLVPCPASSLSTGMNKCDDQFSLLFAAHTQTHPLNFHRVQK